MGPMCVCGAEPTANQRECPACFRRRLLSVNNGFMPSRSAAIDPEASAHLDRRLEHYRKARAEGIQPHTTRTRDVDMALQASDLTGSAYRAGGR